MTSQFWTFHHNFRSINHTCLLFRRAYNTLVNRCQPATSEQCIHSPYTCTEAYRLFFLSIQTTRCFCDPTMDRSLFSARSGFKENACTEFQTLLLQPPCQREFSWLKITIIYIICCVTSPKLHKWYLNRIYIDFMQLVFSSTAIIHSCINPLIMMIKMKGTTKMFGCSVKVNEILWRNFELAGKAAEVLHFVKH